MEGEYEVVIGIWYTYCLAVQAGFYSNVVVFACHACGPGPIPSCNIGERVFILPVTCTCGLCLYVCDVCMHVCVNVCVCVGGGGGGGGGVHMWFVFICMCACMCVLMCVCGGGRGTHVVCVYMYVMCVLSVCGWVGAYVVCVYMYVMCACMCVIMCVYEVYMHVCWVHALE